MPHVFRIPSLTVLLISTCYGAVASADEGGRIWKIPVETIQWEAAVEQVASNQRPVQKTRYDGPPNEHVPATEPAYRVKYGDSSATFEVCGDVPYQRTMIWSAALQSPISPGPDTYYSLRYRAHGIERSYSAVAVLAATGNDSDGKAVSQALLTADQTLNDNRWHTLVGKKSFSFPIDALEVQVTSSDHLGAFEIGQLSFHQSLPEMKTQLTGEHAPQSVKSTRFECIDLSSQLNDSLVASCHHVLDQYGVAVDCDSPQITTAGIPFEIANGEHNLIRPTEDRSANAEPVELLGTKTTRHFFKPLGRDDLTTVPIGRRASEVFFVMATESQLSESCYARPAWPRPMDDIENVAVELQYADGERDLAFPYSLADEGFLVRRGVAAYVVPADPERELTNFVLHNRLFGKTFSLAAVTLNTSPTRVVPEVLLSDAPIQIPGLPQPPHRPVSIHRDGQRITLSNTFYDLVVDCTQGFSLQSLNDRRAETPINLHPASGFEVQLDDTVLTGRAFETTSIELEGHSVTIGLNSLVPEIPLTLNVQLVVDDTPQVTMNLAAENTGSDAIEADVRFPVLHEVTIGDCEDTWLFFPQYRNVITNRTGVYFAPNDCRFPMQVCDIYNPRAGTGLAVLTHNLDHRSPRLLDGEE